MDKNNDNDRNKIDGILDRYFNNNNYHNYEAIDDIFALFEPQQYIPYTSKDFDQFLYKEVRRQGENFKNEISLIEACSFDEGLQITIPVDTDDYKTAKDFDQPWKSFDTVLKEWEYINGSKIGKKV